MIKGEEKPFLCLLYVNRQRVRTIQNYILSIYKYYYI